MTDVVERTVAVFYDPATEPAKPPKPKKPKKRKPRNSLAFAELFPVDARADDRRPRAAYGRPMHG
jgi:hypothetical protein